MEEDFERGVYIGESYFSPFVRHGGHMDTLRSTQGSFMRDHGMECKGRHLEDGPAMETDYRMSLHSTHRDSLRRVIREAVRIKDVKENGMEIEKVVIDDIEKEISIKLKLLNSKKNEFHLPISMATGVLGVSEYF